MKKSKNVWLSKGKQLKIENEKPHSGVMFIAVCENPRN
jgi:hypothetical protein